MKNETHNYEAITANALVVLGLGLVSVGIWLRYGFGLSAIITGGLLTMGGVGLALRGTNNQ